MGIAGGAYLPDRKNHLQVQQIMKRFQSGWILSFFYEEALFAPILCGMSNEKYFSYSMELLVLVKLIKNFVC